MSAVSQMAPVGGVSTAMPRDYFELLKPRVMSLVVFTALVGMAAAPAGLPLPLAAIALIAIACGAGASGALNMWYDADIDAVMSRTASRPLPSGRVAPREALALGIVLSAFSVATLGLYANWLAAGLLAFTIFFYAVVYTAWLKRSTPQNIVIGGAAGALPPVIGWAAMSGSLAVEPWLMFAVIFLWTPPHFWALALRRAGDYQRAGIPMLPNVAGEKATRTQIFLYACLTALAGLLPFLLGYAGTAFGLLAALLGAGFALHAWRVLAAAHDRCLAAAGRLFAFSILYLFALFSALLADALGAFGAW